MRLRSDLGRIERRTAPTILLVAALAVSAGMAGCSAGAPFDDPFAEYTQRTMLVSTSGGDAQAVNTAMQTATPWPRYANNVNIPANGARMAKAIQRYESGASSSEGNTQSSGYPGSSGGAASSGSNIGASTGMTASPPQSPPAQ
jgi:hypothetical protein